MSNLVKLQQLSNWMSTNPGIYSDGVKHIHTAKGNQNCIKIFVCFCFIEGRRKWAWSDTSHTHTHAHIRTRARAHISMETGLTEDLTFPLCVMFLLCFSFAMRILCFATISTPLGVRFASDSEWRSAELAGTSARAGKKLISLYGYVFTSIAPPLPDNGPRPKPLINQCARALRDSVEPV